jgi:phenylacetate-coenzyme A ligase PaaK-like adenylate-forming protein
MRPVRDLAAAAFLDGVIGRGRLDHRREQLVFETGIRQFRMAMAMVTGRRINPRLIELLAADAVATLHEFGTPGDDVRELLDGPFADPESREHFQTQAIRRTVRRIATRSRFYHDLLTDVDVKQLTLAGFSAFPVTTKADLVARGADFVCADVAPYLSTRTTGTTGRPIEIWMSAYEAALWPALAALSGLLRDEIRPTDCLQVNISSRATAAVQHSLDVCRLANARTRVVGQVPAAQSLDSLLDREPTLLGAYPSYLAQLVTEARRRGLGPDDFALRGINAGGEVLSPALATAAHRVFGTAVTDIFGMTETLPVSGRTCEAGHLHPDLNMGLVEVVALDSDEHAAPGDLGRMVVTPYFPYRDCMPILRYDTGDIVRQLSAEPLGCEFAGTPAVSAICGKASQLVRTRAGVVTTRDIVEILESLPSQPWPARYRATESGGVLLLTVPASTLDGITTIELSDRFGERGIDCAIEVSEPGATLRHVRADLLESTFTEALVTTGV